MPKNFPHIELIRALGTIHRPHIRTHDVSLDGALQIDSPNRGMLRIQSENGRIETLEMNSSQYTGIEFHFEGDGEVTFDESLASTGLKELTVFTNGKYVKVNLNVALECTMIDAGREKQEGQFIFDGTNIKPETFNATCLGAVVHGGAGNDTFSGSSCNDNFYGYGGSDTAFGNDGRDYLTMSTGNDIAYGNRGSDCIYGGRDNDTIYGGLDNDIINGDLGSDICYGEDGFDTATAACEIRFSIDQVVGNVTCVPN